MKIFGKTFEIKDYLLATAVVGFALAVTALAFGNVFGPSKSKHLPVESSGPHGVAVAVAKSLDEHPEQWTTHGNMLSNDDRGVGIPYYEKLPDPPESTTVMIDRSIIIESGKVATPDQILVYSAVQRWYAKTAPQRKLATAMAAKAAADQYIREEKAQ